MRCFKQIFKCCVKPKQEEENLRAKQLLPQSQYRVELVKKKILGDVTFDGGRGLVICDPDSSVLGKIHNGEAVFKS